MRLHGVPQSRGRLYQPCIPRHVLRGRRISEEMATQRFVDMYTRFCGVPLLDVESFLLPEDDPQVLQQLRDAEVKNCLRSEGSYSGAAVLTGTVPSQRSRPPPAESPLWVKRHLRIFDDAGRGAELELAREPPEDVMRAWPGLYELSDREWGILKFEGVENFPERPGRAINVAPQLGRHSALTDRVACISTKTRLFLTGRCRLALGSECLQLQGIHFEEAIATQFSNTLLQDLAGNAFQTMCCTACVLSILMTLAMPPTLEEEPSVPKPLRQLGNSSDGDGDPDDTTARGTTASASATVCTAGALNFLWDPKKIQTLGV